jgi:hypothetical protein
MVQESIGDWTRGERFARGNDFRVRRSLAQNILQREHSDRRLTTRQEPGHTRISAIDDHPRHERSSSYLAALWCPNGGSMRTPSG